MTWSWPISSLFLDILWGETEMENLRVTQIKRGSIVPGIPFEDTWGISVPRFSWAQCSGGGVYRRGISGLGCTSLSGWRFILF